MGEHKNIKEFFEKMFETSGMSCEKLSQLTGVPPHYIHALRNMEFDKLPASPYIKGYIKKIAQVMDFNPDELWQLYKNDMNHKTSGIYDKLPINRFAIKKINRSVIVIGIILISVLALLIINYKNIFGVIELNITSPADSPITVTEPQIELTGKISPNDKLTINGVEVLINSAGNFRHPYNLQPGENPIDFKVIKLLGQEKTETRQIIYQTEPAQ